MKLLWVQAMNKEYKKVLKAIKKYNTILILRHEVPDFDASGSQFGLATWIKDNFPNKKVLTLGQPHKFFSPKLYPITHLEENIDEKYLLIIVDVANTPRVDGKEYIENADYIIKIDHHPLCDEFGDVSIIDEHASATAEILGDMLIAFNKKISKQCAYYLYSAIVGDSGRFLYSDTNERTFKVVSKLFESNFNFLDIYDKMYLKSINDLKIINHIYNIYKLSNKGVAYYFIDDATLKQLNIEREQVKAYVNLFSGYDEVKVWVQFSEDITAKDEYRWRVSIRSRGVKINDVASAFNGGGHDNAAGAKCKDENEMMQLIAALDQLL
ncbi:MAG: bifunctional oligoribonuclease/PAP phosphatase NrnA [Erysipelotrichaceae bacterium]|nr:bifunctional oligoribonuclease/PAP phosphatase NrnA [Erysipelotrichaceae bacterium]